MLFLLHLYKTHHMIFPEDIEITEETKVLYKNGDGKFYLTKESAQQAKATHFHCKCGQGV